MLDPFIADWLNLLLRWAHMIAGIAWIGTSFYFVALDFSLKRRAGLPAGVYGEAWEVHGGGFYHVQKYSVAPADMPPDLIWFPPCEKPLSLSDLKPISILLTFVTFGVSTASTGKGI